MRVGDIYRFKAGDWFEVTLIVNGKFHYTYHYSNGSRPFNNEGTIERFEAANTSWELCEGSRVRNILEQYES